MLRGILAFAVVSLLPTIVHAQVVGIASSPFGRWTSTSAGSSPSQGDPVTLRWGIVPDGTAIASNFPGESSAASNLIAALDAAVPGGSGSDLTLRPWFGKFSSATNTLASISGITFVYEAADDGVALNSQPGVTGVRPDMRIGSHAIDGASNTLAYNFFPHDGDMVIDNGDLGSGAGMAVRPDGMFIQTLMHELGHGLGLTHVDASGGNPVGGPSGVAQLMDPFTSFPIPVDPMPQFNDILALQRNYGDALEKGVGNDAFGSATNLGALVDGSPLARGTSAPANATLVEVLSGQTDFVSIDGALDEDFFLFTLSQSGFLTAILDPRGPTYEIGLADSSGPYANFNASMQNDLALDILASDGSTVLGSSTGGGMGVTESVSGLFLGPGTYFARISGANDAAQMYSLELSTISAVPEPSTLAFVGLGMALVGLRLRRKRAAAA